MLFSDFKRYKRIFERNVYTYTQHNFKYSKSDISGYELIDIVEKYNGVLIPAHIFTPFKSYYGNCTERLSRIFKEKYDKIFAVELGLSADTYIADEISELANKNFITNSDAHSLPKIAREYNKLLVNNISFKEIMKAIKMEDGRKILANYGLDPKLGKYNRSFCEDCNCSIETPPPATVCDKCGGTNITMGVYDRIEIIKDQESTSPSFRPKYNYQIPLGFMPGVGGKTIEKLLSNFGTEMTILHKIAKDDIEGIIGAKQAEIIDNARKGQMHIHAGGGGVYGKVQIG